MTLCWKAPGQLGIFFRITNCSSRGSDQNGYGFRLAGDANGSYTAEKAIEVGKVLEANGFTWFEEPCPWEELSETKEIADALSLKVAFGEQDYSLWLFQWMIDNKVMDVVQLDLSYNGGFVRAARVARMARKTGLWFVPHNPQTGAASVNILQVASVIPNTGPYMEYAWRKPQQPESWYSQFIIKNGVLPVPMTPVLGVDFDPDFLKKATIREIVNAQEPEPPPALCDGSNRSCYDLKGCGHTQ